MDSREALIALNLIENVGPIRVRQLLEYFGEAPAILRASRQQLLQAKGIGEETANAIAAWEKTVDLAAELKRIEEYGCRILTQQDEAYPPLLRQIYDPPVVLYVKGQLLPKDKNAVAMVGSRMTTHYGIEIARKLAYQLAYLGVTVVSGGARGIDSAAHQGALSARVAPSLCSGQESTLSPRPRTRNCSIESPKTGPSLLSSPLTAQGTSNRFLSAIELLPA